MEVTSASPSTRSSKSRARKVARSFALLRYYQYTQLQSIRRRSVTRRRRFARVLSFPYPTSCEFCRQCEQNGERQRAAGRVGAKIGRHSTGSSSPPRARLHSSRMARCLYTIAGGIIPKTTKTPKAPALSSACRRRPVASTPEDDGRRERGDPRSRVGRVHLHPIGDEIGQPPSEAEKRRRHGEEFKTSHEPPWREAPPRRGDGIAHRRRVRGHAPRAPRRSKG